MMDSFLVAQVEENAAQATAVSDDQPDQYYDIKLGAAEICTQDTDVANFIVLMKFIGLLPLSL